MFMVAFYGCLLAEVIPVPIEVPLTRKVTLMGTWRRDRLMWDDNQVRPSASDVSRVWQHSADVLGVLADTL